MLSRRLSPLIPSLFTVAAVAAAGLPRPSGAEDAPTTPDETLLTPTSAAGSAATVAAPERRPVVLLLLPDGADRAAFLRSGGGWDDVFAEGRVAVIAPRTLADAPASLRRLSALPTVDRARCFVVAVGPEALAAGRALLRAPAPAPDTLKDARPLRVAALAAFSVGIETATTRIGDLRLSAPPPDAPRAAADAWEFLAAHPARTPLTLRVAGLRRPRGSVVYALYRGAEGFPDDPAKSVARGKAAVNGDTVSSFVADVPPGEYALVLFHDENGDEKLNAGAFGLPLEGFGTSNDPKIRFGPPKWSEARFVVSGQTAAQTLPVRVNYLGEP